MQTIIADQRKFLYNSIFESKVIRTNQTHAVISTNQTIHHPQTSIGWPFQ